MFSKRKAILWNDKLRLKPGDIVRYQNGYYSNKNGKNSIPTNNSDWTYIGEVEKKGSLASRRAENLDEDDILAWQEILNLLKKSDYTNSEGKILSSMIESLGLTELIVSTQTSLSGFVSNYQSYTYEKNDFIAIPDASGNYSLYMFKGGGKTVSSNYLPTGLTNITISMVQDLQAVLDSKLDKPTTTSNTTSYPFVVGEDGNGNSARLPAGDLGKNFFNSDLSNTTARNHTMNAGVTVNTLGNPHTLSGLPNKNADIANFRKVRVQNTSGLDSVVDSKNLLTDGMTSMTDAEKDAWRLAQRKTGETYSIGQPRIDFVFPSYINNSITYVQPLVLYGINLYIDNQTPNSIVQLNRVEDINGNAVNELYNITNFEVSPLRTNQIVLMLNWSVYPKGKYKFKVLNNSLQSLVSDGFVILNDSVPNQISNLTWTVNINPTQAANSSVLNVSNKYFSYERKAVSAGITEATHTMYSDQELTGNFVVELNVGLDETYVAGGANQNVYNLGLITSSSSSSSFTLTVLNGFEFKWEWDYGGIFVTDKGYFKDYFNAKLGSGGRIYYIKHQGYITICFITNNGNLVFLSSAIAVNEPLRLFNSFFNQGRFLNKIVSFSYGQIFTY